MRDQCQRGGWQLGNVMDGTQAEYVCIPWATGGLHHIAEGVNERDLLVFSDILPTSYEVGVLRGGIKPGDTVAIVGAGPVGLAAVITAQLYSPKAIVVFDKNDGRLKVAKSLGATDVINSSKGKVRELSKHHFGELDGFDVVIEAVGIPATFQMCQDLVGIGGRIANVGVHGTRVSLDIDKHWPRSISMIINHIRDERLRFD
jgi:alcohol dehydrogenase